MKAFYFMTKARQAKVDAMLGRIPLAASLEERENLAIILEKATPEWRNKLAAAIGIENPSDATWALFVAAIRTRPLATADEVRAAAAQRRAS